MTDYNKKQYTLPRIDLIELDNEISLALQSNPPTGPLEVYHSDTIGVKNNSPYQTV